MRTIRQAHKIRLNPAPEQEPYFRQAAGNARFAWNWAGPKARALSEELMLRWDGLWVFVTVEGVEPTNNAAEQALRPAVLWRKGSFGTQSDAGSRFVERMLTVRETCRRQGRELRVFVMEAVAAHRAGREAPRLLAGA